ncbi:MFS transporter [Pseudonocardia alni]|uniref:MFS transporter n=1 Tax=Pseudonocardia alni TaxID=33907 RepID=UPI003323F8A5
MLLICLAVIVLDGYDVIVYGATLPALLAYPEWALTPATVGLIGSVSTIAGIIVTLPAGYLVDRFGPRRVLLIATAVFSLGTLACGVAPSVEIFIVARFVVGLGLKPIVPACIVLVLEYAPVARKVFFGNATQTGWSIGGIIASACAVVLVPAFGFRPSYILGGVLLVVVFPFMLRYLPESLTYLARTGRVAEARAVAAQYSVDIEPLLAVDRTEPTGGRWDSLKIVLSRRYLRATIVFSVVSFLGFLLAYGIGTWLPAIMVKMGYPLGASISFLVALNMGNVVGILVAGRLADRYGPRATLAWSMLIAAVIFAVLSIAMPQVALYALIAAAGFGAQGTSVLLLTYTGTYYPTSARGTALGFVVGIAGFGAIAGPIVGGLVAGSTLAPAWNFYIFAAVAVLAGLSILLVPNHRAPGGEPAPVTGPALAEALAADIQGDAEQRDGSTPR